MLRHLWLAGAFFFTGCTQYAYFQSPLNGATHGYRTIPLKRDSLSASTYAGGSLAAGGANQSLRDNTVLGSVAIHRSHRAGIVQGYYGLNIFLGSYEVATVVQPSSEGFQNTYFDANAINKGAGRKFVGAYGFSAGLNAAIPLVNGGEWRVIGVEFSWNHEFGEYLKFRKQLADSAANLIDRGKNFSTLGLSTDFVAPIRQGSIGYKITLATGLNRMTNYDETGNPRAFNSGFMTHTLHVRHRRLTGYVTFVAGSYNAAFVAGAQHQIAR